MDTIKEEIIIIVITIIPHPLPLRPCCSMNVISIRHVHDQRVLYLDNRESFWYITIGYLGKWWVLHEGQENLLLSGIPSLTFFRKGPLCLKKLILLYMQALDLTRHF